MARKEEKRVKQIINEGISEGIHSITKHHPRFRNLDNYLAEFLDMEKITNRVREIYKTVNTRKNFNPENIQSYLRKEIAEYVSTGNAFNDEGKEFVLRSSLEERAEGSWFNPRNWGAKRELESEKYFDRTLGAWREVYDIFAQGGGYEMPELLEPLQYLNRAGFADIAIHKLKGDGMINDITYARIKRNLREGVQKARGEAENALEKYSGYNQLKAVAAMLSLSGIGVFLFYGSGITGSAVGISNNNLGGLFIGAVISVIGLVLLLTSFKN